MKILDILIIIFLFWFLYGYYLFVKRVDEGSDEEGWDMKEEEQNYRAEKWGK